MADAKMCDRCGSFYKDDSAYGAFTKIARFDSTYKVVKSLSIFVNPVGEISMIG